MEDFNRLSSKIVCYNYTFWQMNTFCVRKCTHSMVSVLILALNCKKKKKKSEILLRDNVMIHQFQISLKVSTTSYFVYKKMFSIHWFYMYDNCARPEQYYPPPFRISRSHCHYLKIFFLEINFNILKQRMVNLNFRNLLHACNLYFLNKKNKKTKQRR